MSASKVAALVQAQRIDEELSEVGGRTLALVPAHTRIHTRTHPQVQGRASPTSDTISSCSGFATPLSTMDDDADADNQLQRAAVSPSPIHSLPNDDELSTPPPEASAGLGSAICFDTPALPTGAIIAQQHVRAPPAPVCFSRIFTL